MRYIKLFALWSILVTSCQPEKIEIPDTGRKIVINGLITTDSLLNVFISKSGYIDNYYYESKNDMGNAKVYIYQNNICIDSLYHSKLINGYLNFNVYFPGNYYSTRVSPITGNEYKIVVKVPGLPDATSSIKIPDLVKISIVDTMWAQVTATSESYGRMTCNVEFTDPPNEENYYLFNICSRSKLQDSIFSSYGDSIIREPYLTFDCQDPIVEEKITCQTWGYNIEGIVFSDRIINGKKHSLTVSYRDERYVNPFYNDSASHFIYGKEAIYFRLYSITKEYFKYIQTLNLFYDKLGNPLSEPVKVYSNVTGGYGIFAGAAVSCDSIVVSIKKITYDK